MGPPGMVRVPRPPRAGSGGFFLLSVIFKALLLKKSDGRGAGDGQGGLGACCPFSLRGEVGEKPTPGPKGPAGPALVAGLRVDVPVPYRQGGHPGGRTPPPQTPTPLLAAGPTGGVCMEGGCPQPQTPIIPPAPPPNPHTAQGGVRDGAGEGGGSTPKITAGTPHGTPKAALGDGAGGG